MLLNLRNLFLSSKYAFALRMILTCVIFIGISSLLLLGASGYYATDSIQLCCMIQPLAVIGSIALKKKDRAISIGLLIAVILWDIVLPTIVLLHSAYLCQTQGICSPS